MSAEIISPSASDISLFHRPYGPRLHRDEEALAPQPFVSPNPPLPADAPAEFDSAEGATKYLLSLNRKPAAEGAREATAANELPVEGNAASEKAPGENVEKDPAEKSPVERPRSWSKDDDDDWNALPRERQEKIAASERAREADINQRITKAAETTKAYEAKAAQADQATARHMQALVNQNNQQFSNIKSQDDVDFLESEAVRLSQTPGQTELAAQYLAYLSAWRGHQQKMAQVKAELDQAEGQKAQKQETEWNNHVHAENEKAAELIPEIADKEKRPAFYKRALDRLTELKFSKEEIADLATGKQKLSIHDHRLQILLSSDFKLTDIQKAKIVAAKPNLPPVQRPGTASSRGEQQSDNVKALNSKLTNSGDIRDAVALYAARKSARR